MSDYATAHPEVLAFLSKRRSHPSKTMTGPGPDDETLQKLLSIASRVPDHGKLAPWRFVIYPPEKTPAIGQKLLEIAERREGPLDEARRDQELTRFTRAPVVIGVISSAAIHPKIPVWEQELSAGAVCMNMVSAAAASGFASQWLSEWFAFDEEAAQYLGCAEGERFAGFIHIGTPTLPPTERARPELSEIVSYWTERQA
ncbi:nitroreductase [Roseibium hamelinense]|uniref:Putative NAD(P)H nitroreductase n=1 Tax=Roseibium hamelinense TaxID=150831 RepID=A0A562TC32_9HYPH|nr:nitroreductase [Roseibium hamelinense]MTI42233.1 nitroreductase [Roseibium hamelinense]TWI90550.1 nitroreductase [Roseibium hamelinense]